MNHLFGLSLVTTTLMLAGCAVGTQNVVSTNSDVLVVGDEPEGYPRVTFVRIGDHCTRVTESWNSAPDAVGGKTIWLKQIERASVLCSDP